MAFDLARSRRGKLTVVHKANVLKLTTGLFRTVWQEVTREYRTWWSTTSTSTP
ncbi:isocitrate/isopropylmalate family dehydrogenase [Streptomyces europaeiscabiei]|nr:isocitrate/isopropylmalate family dehydrogenase [Streptomyces europaeiscabiei]MDX2760723.1 isocitrate/isopropylmalate family dehydrogenase [Streptomyces europaeiscabiei]MDX2774750.1 isocitrate/isopropylmalate family dehydrogenase [Streptomyces europaeiscabiei]MDX3708063.1 isocitrate/isopropylmalate family dehydrogenase [Streptomyces europaeiscabiei]MDX3873884.1 isocitrate/isopropylmalate family dehydrogenase [Streptomyces europaeiscabiei]